MFQEDRYGQKNYSIGSDLPVLVFFTLYQQLSNIVRKTLVFNNESIHEFMKHVNNNKNTWMKNTKRTKT